MPQGDKSSYTDKQKRKAQHIEQSYEERGVSHKEAQARAWATVNKDSGGGNKSGSGRGKPDSHASARKGSVASARRSAADRSAAGKKGWETRRKRAGH
ncbi:plasmid stabilization protein [Sphingobium sp. WCS2017Hpa-17]|uniref:plasmid stabilization protein n=1 Tax=Sphingobium sp. WCS2017Hpa-17 TaxID=3073638 RepID=UPI002889147F|nr:plasmid stabilization protein [Sphingobium sp. WCS2017Hpa-17]